MYFFIDKFFINNLNCKAENGSYEIFASWGSSTPINITERIKNNDCECINEFLVIEKNLFRFHKSNYLN